MESNMQYRDREDSFGEIAEYTITGVQLNRIKMLIEEFEIILEDRNARIHMRDWCELEYAETKEEAKRKLKDAVDNPCGTAACLAGKAGLMRRFRNLGFKWTMKFEPGFFSYDEGHFSGEFEYRDSTGDDAVREFFGDDAYEELFMDFTIKSVRGGIYRLKQFVNRVEKERAA